MEKRRESRREKLSPGPQEEASYCPLKCEASPGQQTAWFGEVTRTFMRILTHLRNAGKLTILNLNRKTKRQQA